MVDLSITNCILEERGATSSMVAAGQVRQPLGDKRTMPRSGGRPLNPVGQKDSQVPKLHVLQMEKEP